MGGGTYSYSSRMSRATASGMMTNSLTENFKSKAVVREMKSVDVEFRESRDSDEHPASVAIIVALDVTGSMGAVPDHLVKHGLPTMMDAIINRGLADPQVLFMGIGDHIWDKAPLQVGQFESSDELLDKWLTSTWLEGNGGGNDGESYMLAWYFAARHTQIDCMDKREKKGFLFTIGDEPVLSSIEGSYLERIMGKGQYGEEIQSKDLLDEARKLYEVHHIHISETPSGARKNVQEGWRQLMGEDNLTVVQSSDHVSSAIASIVSGVEGIPDSETDEKPAETEPDEPPTEEIL